MADKKISELTALTSPDPADLVPVVDVSASETKKSTLEQVFTADVNRPTANEKAAMVGTSGAPSAGNRFVTNADSRLTDARTPTAHATTHEPGGTDPITTSLEFIAIPRTQADSQTIGAGKSAVVVGPYTINAGQTLTFADADSRLQILGGGTPLDAARAAVGISIPFVGNVGSIGVPVMNGLGNPGGGQRGWLITPTVSKRVAATFSGSIGIVGTARIQLRYGVGTPPVAGGLEAGFVLADIIAPSGWFTVSEVVEWADLNVQMWFDLAFYGPATIFISDNTAVMTAVEV